MGLFPTSANASPKQQNPRYKSSDDKNPVHASGPAYLSRMTNPKTMRTAAIQAIPRTTEIIGCERIAEHLWFCNQ